jgi:hypothetical protein
MTDLSFEALRPEYEQFIIAPEPSPEAYAAAIICGHKIIQDLGVDGMCDFQAFVQEVLATTVSPEIERLKRALESK